MRNLIAVSAIALALGFTSPASAQYRHYHNHYNGGWGAPLVGGLIVGGILGSMVAQPRYQYDYPPVVVAPSYPRYCRNVVVGRDYYTGRPIIERVCE